jgi:prepilin-type N-terminal cleavage/methylation domain-containing protein
MNFEEQTTTDAQAGFSLLEAMISVALVAIAMVGAFSVSKVMLQSKQLVDQKTDFQLASQTLNNNIALGLQTISLSDVVAIPDITNSQRILYTLGLPCPPLSGGALRNLLQSELCRMRFFQYNPPRTGDPRYRVELINEMNTTEDATLTNRYLRIKISFINTTTNLLEFERVFLHVK